MPRRMKTKRTRKPYRKYKRYVKRSLKASTAIIRTPSMIPDRMKVKLRYTEVFNISVGSGVQTYNLFSANSIYDPDATGVGHQPLGHDQWNAFYEKYMVYGSSINLKWLSTGDGFVWYAPQTSSTFTGSLSLVKEQPYTRIYTYNSQGSNRSQAKSYMSTKKIMGMKTTTENDDNLASPFGTNPTQRWYWAVGCYDVNGSTTVATSFTIVVEIVYYVVLFDRIDRLGQS